MANVSISDIDKAASDVQQVLAALHELRNLMANAPDDALTSGGASTFDKELNAAAAGTGAHLDEGRAKFIELTASQEQLLALAESAKSDINANSRGQQVVDGIKKALSTVTGIAEALLPALLG